MAIHSLAKARAHIERLKEKSEEAISHGLQVAEVGGAAAVAGYVNTKFGSGGELQFQGVPADLLAGIGLHAMAFLGVAGKYNEHAHNLGDGFVAAYAYRAGAQAAR